MKKHTEYRTCPWCGANNDPEELCTCPYDKTLNPPNIPVSETLLVSVDIAGGDEIACLQVYKQIGKNLKQVNIFYGGEARKLYDILRNNEIESKLYADNTPFSSVMQTTGATLSLAQIEVAKEKIKDNHLPYIMQKDFVSDNPVVDDAMIRRLRGIDPYPERELTSYEKADVDSDMIG